MEANVVGPETHIPARRWAIGTKFNPADFFTKALPKHEFSRYRGYLGMEDHAASA